MEKKVNTPKPGAARKWAKRLKELREQPPTGELLRFINPEEYLRQETAKAAGGKLKQDEDVIGS